MHPDSVDKTVFITPEECYDYLRVIFGLCNSLAVFQRVFNKTLGKLRYGKVFEYIDDQLIPFNNVDERLALLDLIQRAGMKLKLQKCFYLQNQIEYVGYEMGTEGVRPTERKIQAVKDFFVHKDVHGV